MSCCLILFGVSSLCDHDSNSLHSLQVPESHPERNAGPGDDPNLDLTFKPKILKSYKLEGERTNFFKKVTVL